MAVSPEGRFVAFDVIEGQRRIVVAQRLGGQRSRWQLSSEGGELPRWSRDGSQVFFLDGTRLMSAPVTIEGDVLRPGRTREIANGGFLVRGFGGAFGVANYDVMPDGQTFILVRSEQQADLDDDRVMLVLNFDPSQPLVATK